MHGQDAGREHADIEQLLHCVVLGGIVMGEVQPHCILDGGDELAPADREQHASEAPGGEAISEIGEPIYRQDPHAEEMPLQAMLGPVADGDGVGKMQPAEDHLVIVDFPAAADHHDHGRRIDPMHDTDRQRMEFLRVRRGGSSTGGLHFRILRSRKLRSGSLPQWRDVTETMNVNQPSACKLPVVSAHVRVKFPCSDVKFRGAVR